MTAAPSSTRPCVTWQWAFFLGALLLLSCGKAPTAVTPPLRIGLDLWAGYYPLVIADERGFLAAENVRVDLRFPQDTHRMIAEFAAHQHDAVFASLGDVILTTRAEPDIRMVLCSDESVGGDQILGRGELTSATQIRGRRVGTTLGGFGEILVRHFLNRHGLKPSEVALINADAADVPTLLQRDQLDIGHTWEPYAAQARAAGFSPWFTSADTPGLILDGMIVHGALVRERPAELRGLLRGWFRALEWWRAHPAEGNALVERRLSLPAGSVSAEGVRLLDRAENRRLFTGGSGPNLPAAVTEYVEFFLSRGTLARRLGAEEILDPRFIE